MVRQAHHERRSGDFEKGLMRKRSSLTPLAVVGYDESVVNLAQACDHYVGI